jgi:YtkA-like
MSHPGMVPVFAEATEIEPGRYSAVMDLSMAGDWIVVVHIVLPDGRKTERLIQVKGVA